MTDYPVGDEAQHLRFNKTVREAAEQARIERRQLFRERFNTIMGYYPEVSEERTREFLFGQRDVEYRVGQYWLCDRVDEETGTPYLVLGNKWFESPAEIADRLTDYGDDDGVI